MATTIQECLENANYNISNNGFLGLGIGKEQLKNAVVLLSKGYGLDDLVDDLIEKYPNIEEAPRKS